MLGDLIIVLKWWFYLFLLGIVFLPFTKRVFSQFWDKGYLFAKVLGIGFISFFVWLLAIFKFFPFSEETIFGVLIIFLLGNYLFLFKKNPEDKEQSIKFSSLLVEELIFFLALVFWSFVRGLQPDIQGLEKFMDFGFVNAILRSKYFPPADMWFAGKSINYYYFGHYITAFLTKLTNIPSAITYNLMMATLFAFCFSLSFSLTGNLIYLWKKFSSPTLATSQKLPTRNFFFPIISGGLIAAFLISLGANLHPAYYNFKMKVFKKPYCNGSFFYWYPDATRYIGYCPDVEDKTIHEFPSYSFVVSDLHGHVSDIPFVLTFLALILALFPQLKEKRSSFYLLTKGYFFLFSFLLAIMFMTNQWDYPIYLIVFGTALLAHFFLSEGFSLKSFGKAFGLGIITLGVSVVLVLPFWFNFEQIAKGIAFVHAHSRFYQLLILWGAFWFFGLSYTVFVFKPNLKTKKHLNKELVIKFLSQALGVEVKIKGEKKSLESGKKLKLLFPDWYVLVLLGIATLLIIIPEIIYVKDIYIASHHRANTMFKLTYQSFIMFCVCTGFIFYRVLTSLKKNIFSFLLRVIYSLLIISLLIYPFYAIPGYYGKFSYKNYKGLFGLGFLKSSYPDDYKAIEWFGQEVQDQPHILEAVGDSYTDYNRISMATGLPTIQGWLVHEWLWRGSFDEPGKRSAEVQTIYETKDLNTAKEILKKYQVKYVVVGEMERTKYPQIYEEKFSSLGKKVFQSGKMTIYAIDYSDKSS